jgi:hypothetical protein
MKGFILYGIDERRRMKRSIDIIHSILFSKVWLGKPSRRTRVPVV